MKRIFIIGSTVLLILITICTVSFWIFRPEYLVTGKINNVDEITISKCDETKRLSPSAGLSQKMHQNRLMAEQKRQNN